MFAALAWKAWRVSLVLGGAARRLDLEAKAGGPCVNFARTGGWRNGARLDSRLRRAAAPAGRFWGAETIARLTRPAAFGAAWADRAGPVGEGPRRRRADWH